ncbi:outer membrane beta-barrel protein [Paraflavisolibacter sp. H34]|uniref:outer membrane beta-barrel protein n=1 Tax=Huijunlia imazamoxiresistens TaxID=3127457 RepID=UPI00301715CE
MKKILSLAVLALGISAAHAQTFKPFKVDVSLGYASPQGKGSKGGVLFAIEPKYAVIDQISVGLRLESALTAAGYVSDNGEEFSGDVKAHGSYVLTGDYYFTNTKARPFLGTGLGLYKSAGATFDTNTNDEVKIDSENKVGFLLRGGVEVGHFRTGLEYNFVGNKNGYLGVKVGVCIGGGRRD